MNLVSNFIIFLLKLVTYSHFSVKTIAVIRMGDTEMVAAQASSVAEKTAAGDSATGYGDASGNIAPDSTETAGSDSIPQDAHVDSEKFGDETATYGISENLNNHVDSMMDSSEVAYDLSVNGNGAGEAGTVAVDGVTENGVASHDAHQLVDDVLSAEEERLWNIVNANSLEFNAWTALIEETERMAMVS